MKNIIIILRLVYAALFITMSSAVFSQNCIEKCEGECITYTASETGGTGPYTYLWDDNTTLDSLVDCTVGVHMHSVTVTDANGCIAVQTAQGEIFAPFPLLCAWRPDNVPTATFNCSPIYCDNDGVSTLIQVNPFQDRNNCIITDPNNNIYNASSPTGGGFEITDAMELSGVWTVCCEDRNGCETCVDFTFTEGQCDCDITPTAVATDVTCNGGSDGIITVTENGVAPYIYVWTGGASGNPATGLSAGTYTVTVTDDDGCTGSVTATISEPTILVATCSSTDVICNGDADGTGTVVASGGTGPYTYLWDNSQTTATATGLAAGTYTVTVTDANGCTETCSVTISEPTQLVVSCSHTDVLCNGDTDGTATVVASGGTAPYTYLWDDLNASTTANVTGLAAGTYTVTVTDANGCTETCSVTIIEPTLLTAAISCN